MMLRVIVLGLLLGCVCGLENDGRRIARGYMGAKVNRTRTVKGSAPKKHILREPVTQEQRQSVKSHFGYAPFEDSPFKQPSHFSKNGPFTSSSLKSGLGYETNYQIPLVSKPQPTQEPKAQSWVPKYPSNNGPFGPSSQGDDGSYYPGKYSDDDGSYNPQKYGDDGSYQPHKYGDDGSYTPSKYPGSDGGPHSTTKYFGGGPSTKYSSHEKPSWSGVDDYNLEDGGYRPHIGNQAFKGSWSATPIHVPQTFSSWKPSSYPGLDAAFRDPAPVNEFHYEAAPVLQGYPQQNYFH